MKLLKILILGLMVILISRFIYSQWYTIYILNTQSQATPSPFQQDIAICNGSINIGPNFAYINNVTLFIQINPNGQNVYFATTNGSAPNIYSWYEGQLINGNTYCDVWWVNLPNGISADSNITIYMNVGPNSANYYSQYYPYVGASPQVISGYDNGQDVFVAYGYFNNTFDGWKGYIFTGSYSPTATSYGIEMLNGGSNEGTYILPPNNWNIPLIPLIVEEAWYCGGVGHANVIALFGNTSQQIYAASIGSTSGVDTPAPNLSTFVQFQYDYGANPPNSQATMLKSAVTDQYLNYTFFSPCAEIPSLGYNGVTYYTYLLVNSTYAQAGYYIYNGSSQVWVPLKLLDMYEIYYSALDGYPPDVYYNLNYNPFQYGTLEIAAGDGASDTSTQYVEWVVARAYPPNGVMPNISLQSPVFVSSVQLSPSSSSPVCPGTQTNSTVTANLNNLYNISTTVTFSCSAPPGIICSVNPSSCDTSGSSCSTTLYVNSSTLLLLEPSKWYTITITNTQFISIPGPFQQDIAICNGSINVGPNFAYINNVTLFNQINPNGQNVYFATTNGSAPNIYSWYEGQLNYNGVTCDVWWVNIPNGIPANSNIVIYMAIGNYNIDYYYQYYPYVGASPQVISGYDNGQDVFVAYGYFNNTFDGWGGYLYNGSLSPTATPSGIEMLNYGSWEGTYILPPNNWNIPLIPLIVEEAWYFSPGADANVISLFGNTYNQVNVRNIGSTAGGYTPASISSTFVQFEYWSAESPPYSQAAMLKSAVTDQYLNYTSFPVYVGTIYSYLIVNSSYVQAGYYIYNSNQVWAPLSLLDMYPLSYNPNYGNYTYYNLNYSPYQYPTLEISAGSGLDGSYQYVEWVVARAYPPNGVMPSISISPISLFTQAPGSYSVTVTASTSGSSVSTTYTYNIGQQISISSQQSSNFQNSYDIYITGCSQNYTLYVNNSPYCYDSYSQFQNINSLCIVSYPGSYSVYAQGCYNGTCVNSNIINLNIPSSGGITVPIIDINILNITNQNINTSISVNGVNQNIQSINVYYNNNNVYSNNSVNTNYYSFNLQLPYSNNGNITVCSTLTNGQSGCVTEIFNLNVAQTYIYYGIIQLKATIQPININTTYGPIGNNLEFSLDYPEYILTLNITNIGNIALNNITINLQQFGNVPEILYNGIPIGMSNNININQLQPNQSYILQFNVLPLYIGSSSLLLNFNVNGQNIGNAQYNLIVNGPSNNSSLIVSENINYILILLGIIGSIIFLI